MRTVLQNPAYTERFSMDVHEQRSERGAWAEKRYPFGRDRHGFVVVDAVGDVRACRPGHFYGAKEIEADVRAVMAGRMGSMPKQGDVFDR